MSKESAAAAAAAEAAAADRLKRSLAVQVSGHEAAMASLKVRWRGGEGCPWVCDGVAQGWG